jgi:hypothetical protein
MRFIAMLPKRRKKVKTPLEKMSTKTLVGEIRKDLHTMILEAEGALPGKKKKQKKSNS